MDRCTQAARKRQPLKLERGYGYPYGNAPKTYATESRVMPRPTESRVAEQLINFGTAEHEVPA